VDNSRQNHPREHLQLHPRSLLLLLRAHPFLQKKARAQFKTNYVEDVELYLLVATMEQQGHNKELVDP